MQAEEMLDALDEYLRQYVGRTRGLAWQEPCGICRMEFPPGDQWHDETRGHREDDADETFRHPFLLPQSPARLDEHVEGQRQECAADKAMDPSLASLDSFRVGPPCLDAEPPEECRGGRTLDEAIKAKAHQGDTPGLEARPKCHPPSRRV
jgi:hypothetical protein